ncbi:MAG: NUDIX hydrolase [Desulfomonile sp.]|nr:NUDIX hydrolase [Deltaproteobacteria bacterium]
MESRSEDRNLHWELIDSREDRSYRLFSVAINRNRSPRTGEIHEFQILNSPDWVAVIALTPKNEMILVRQYRHGISGLSLEPPGGLVKEGQSPEQSGREELEEETGYQAPSLELLGWMHPMPALFSNRFYVFFARDATPDGRLNPDDTEEVETVLVPVDKVREYIRSGVITCGTMIAALHLFFDWEDHGKITSP